MSQFCDLCRSLNVRKQLYSDMELPIDTARGGQVCSFLGAGVLAVCVYVYVCECVSVCV